MRSTTRLILAASLTLASTGCTVFGGKQALVVAPEVDCVGLVPSRWRDGVPHTADPDPAAPAPAAPASNAPDSQKAEYWHRMYDLALNEAKKWTVFGVSEYQVATNANGRTNDTLDIVGGCEKRAAAAVKKAAH
jgi:hypothetical protein